MQSATIDIRSRYKPEIKTYFTEKLLFIINTSTFFALRGTGSITDILRILSEINQRKHKGRHGRASAIRNRALRLPAVRFSQILSVLLHIQHLDKKSYT